MCERKAAKIQACYMDFLRFIRVRVDAILIDPRTYVAIAVVTDPMEDDETRVYTIHPDLDFHVTEIP